MRLACGEYIQKSRKAHAYLGCSSTIPATSDLQGIYFPVFLSINMSPSICRSSSGEGRSCRNGGGMRGTSKMHTSHLASVSRWLKMAGWIEMGHEVEARAVEVWGGADLHSEESVGWLVQGLVRCLGGVKVPWGWSAIRPSQICARVDKMGR